MKRIIDLTLPVDSNVRGVEVELTKTIETHGWNARTLTLYSHSGTHMDAPCHFLPDGASLDSVPLEACVGPARILDLTPVEPRELITVERLAPWHDEIGKGDRVLLRTDWYKRHGTPAYRDELPRISADLARWLADRGVSLIGVESPSVAEISNRDALKEVHHALLNAGMVIVEGLANMDAIPTDIVELIVLPLRIAGGDGSPVRAIATYHDRADASIS